MSWRARVSRALTDLQELLRQQELYERYGPQERRAHELCFAAERVRQCLETNESFTLAHLATLLRREHLTVDELVAYVRSKDSRRRIRHIWRQLCQAVSSDPGLGK